MRGSSVVRAAGGAVALAIVAGAVDQAQAGRPPNPAKVEAMKQRREGSLDVGDRAPDVSVAKLDGGADTVLAHKKPNRPMVLVFGSFT